MQLSIFDIETPTPQLACEKPTRKYPNGRTGTRPGYRAHMDAKETPCELCKEGRKDQAKAYREKNLERIQKYSRRYREENPEYFRDYERKRRKENPEYFREHDRKRNKTDERREYRRNYTRKLRKENPGYRREYDRQYGRKHYRENTDMYRRQTRNRRARERALPSELYTVQDITNAHGKVCYLCNTHVDINLPSGSPTSPHVDHVHPLSREGCPGDVLENCRIVHARCNLIKGAKLVSELALPFPPPQLMATDLPGPPAPAQ